ncbi:MAG: DUF2184 domain-containing protein [Clostridia bacterium]|nr:DUF2184 domain-containing protein [Clostridia bacterium]
MFVNPSTLRRLGRDSYLFLTKELEKVDDQILEPLSGTDWPRDMPVITGGGLVESIGTIGIAYSSTGGDEDNIFFEAANDIPVIQADLSKSVARTMNFAEYMSFPVLEQEKMIQVGRDPVTFLDQGIRLHCDKSMDHSVYVGVDKARTTGLLNNPEVIRGLAAPATAGGSDTQWAAKTADQILRDVNQIISDVWRDNDCSSDALPNHILVPIEQFGQLVTRKVSDDSERSILTYLHENNLTRQQGGDLIISPCKYCAGAGSGGKDRMVVYMNRVDRICFNITQPLKRMETEFSSMCYKIPYIAQFSEVRFLYPSTVRYMDGI